MSAFQTLSVAKHCYPAYVVGKAWFPGLEWHENGPRGWFDILVCDEPGTPRCDDIANAIARGDSWRRISNMGRWAKFHYLGECPSCLDGLSRGDLITWCACKDYKSLMDTKHDPQFGHVVSCRGPALWDWYSSTWGHLHEDGCGYAEFALGKPSFMPTCR